MNYSLRFHPELHNDLIRNLKWYQNKDPSLANAFIELFYSSVQKITVNPLAYVKINEDYRRILMKKFPYTIYFYIENETVIVAGLFHVAQNPEKIIKKLQKRNT